MNEIENNNIKSIMLVLTMIVALTLIIVSISSASAENIGVNKTTAVSGENFYYNDISSAIGNASNCDTITIYNGTYQGVKNRNISINNKNLTIQGADYAQKETGQTIIDAQKFSNIFNIGSNCNIKIYGLIFINGNDTSYESGGDGTGGAISQEYNGTLIIINSTFTNNNATNSGGAINQDSGAITMKNSTLNNDSATTSGGVIYQGTFGILSINNSSFNGNNASNGGVIYNEYYGSLNISNSNFTNNNNAITSRTSNIALENNKILQNEIGIVLILNNENIDLSKCINLNTFKDNKYILAIYGNNSTVKNANIISGPSNENGIGIMDQTTH